MSSIKYMVYVGGIPLNALFKFTIGKFYKCVSFSDIDGLREYITDNLNQNFLIPSEYDSEERKYYTQLAGIKSYKFMTLKEYREKQINNILV